MDSIDRVAKLNGAEDKITLEELNRLRNFLSYGMIFSPDYTCGYTNALQDMLELISDGYFERVCRHNRITKNFKTMQKIIKAMIGHREALRDRFHNHYLIWDADKKDFKVGVLKIVKKIEIEE